MTLAESFVADLLVLESGSSGPVNGRLGLTREYCVYTPPGNAQPGG